MVQVREITNKETGEVYKTQEGVTLKEIKFEAGDVFIPQLNQILHKKVGEYDTYKIVCKIKGYGAEDNVFVRLTPAQKNTLQKKIDKGEDLTQMIMCAYNYEYDGKEYVGVGVKPKIRKPLNFSDFNDEDDDYLDQLTDYDNIVDG